MALFSGRTVEVVAQCSRLSPRRGAKDCLASLRSYRPCFLLADLASVETDLQSGIRRKEIKSFSFGIVIATQSFESPKRCTCHSSARPSMWRPGMAGHTLEQTNALLFYQLAQFVVWCQAHRDLAVVNPDLELL